MKHIRWYMAIFFVWEVVKVFIWGIMVDDIIDLILFIILILLVLNKANMEVYVDALTGIGNRKALMARINALDKKSSQFLYAIIDLNNFKAINDTYGHEIGDRALIAIAKMLKNHFHKEVYRYGGDEFILVIPVSSEDFSLCRRKVEDKLTGTIKLRIDVKQILSIKYAVGISHSDSEEYIALADKAMYENKNKKQ